MRSTDGPAKVAFEVFEERAAVALRDDLPDQAFELRNDCLRQAFTSTTSFKTRTLRKLKWHLRHHLSANNTSSWYFRVFSDILLLLHTGGKNKCLFMR
jgi:hypothetical protein